MDRLKAPKKSSGRAPSIAAEEQLLPRSGLPDPRAEPDLEGAATAVVSARELAPPSERDARVSGPAPAHTARIVDLERQLEIEQCERAAAAEKVAQLEQVIERMKRDRVLDQTKVAELTAEVSRIDGIAKEAVHALESLSRAFDAMDQARVDAREARGAALDALRKLSG
jgi:hypothetical protein